MNIMIGKLGETVPVELKRMFATEADYESFMAILGRNPVIEHEFVYGLRQILNDCHSDVTVKSHPEAEERGFAVRAAVGEKLASLYAGNVRSHGGGGRTADPAMQLALAEATIAIKAKMKENGLKATDFEPEMARKLVAANPKFLADARKKLGELPDFDLTTVGL